MSSKVWLSSLAISPKLLKPFTSAFAEADLRGVVDVQERNVAGEKLDRTNFPSELWGTARLRASRPLPQFFSAGGVWVTSSLVADVLRQHDLGGGALYPVTLLQKDRATPFPDQYYALNFGSVKDVFLPTHSRAEQNPFNPSVWYLETLLKDDDIAVHRSALEGADLWVSPPLTGAFFVSERLEKALRAAKVASAFGLYRCRVI